MSLQAIDTNELIRDLERHLNHNGFPGLLTPFQALNEYYTHKSDGCTDWTGFPSSGKTYFLLELLMSLSEKYGHRHGLYVPDIGSPQQVYAKLLKMRTGYDMTDKYHKKMDISVLHQNLPWLQHHFILFKRKDFKKPITPVYFWETMASYDDGSGKLNTCVADSWKNFKHIYTGREDSYLDEVLSYRNEIAEESQMHIHTVAHAVKTDVIDKKDNKRRVPNANDIKGGGSWYANGKNIITIDRPNRKTNQVNIYINKVKPEDVGQEGAIINKIFLDAYKGRYYEEIMGHRAYAYQYEKSGSYEQQSMNLTYGSPV